MVSTTTKLVCSVIAAIFFSFIYDSAAVIPSFSSYIISYHIRTEPKNNPSEDTALYFGFLFLPVFEITMYLFTPLSAYLGNKLKCHLTIIIGAIICLLANTLLYFSNLVYTTLLSLLLFGMGVGLSLNVPIKNACSFMPERKGLISAIIVSIGHISGALCSIGGEYIVNNERMELKEDEELFPLKIAERVRIYYTYMFVFIGICLVLSLLFVFQYKPGQSSLIQEIKLNNDFSLNTNDNEFDVYYSPQIQPKRSARKEQELLIPPMTLSATIMPLQFDERDNKYNKNFKQILHSCRFWMLAVNYSCTVYSSSMHLTVFKPLGIKHNFNVDMLTFTYASSFCLLTVIGPLIGYFSDHVSFKVLNTSMNVIGIISNIAMLYSLQYNDQTVFAVFNVIHLLCCPNMLSILNAHVMKVYTLQFFVEAIGVLGIFSVIGSIFESCIPLIMTTYLNDNDNKIAYCIGIGLNIIGIILSMIEKDTEFKFQTKEVERDKESEEINDL